MGEKIDEIVGATTEERVEAQVQVERVALEADGVEVEVEEVEIEVHVRAVERLPLAKRYVLRIDDAKYTVEAAAMTGRELLALAKKSPPEQYEIEQVFGNGTKRTVGLDELVDFRAPGVERFITAAAERDVRVIVNGRPKTVPRGKLCFDAIVKLAFEAPPTAPNTIFTITYKHAAGSKPEGILVEGECVQIKEGTIFNVTATVRS